MADVVNIQEMILAIEGIATGIDRKVDDLTRLDQAIGDGDHGISMRKGFGAVLARSWELNGKDAGQVLETVGNILLANVGGAAGALYGTAFMQAGNVVKGKYEITLSDLGKMFESAEQGIIDVGGAALGDKTMLDAIHPAVLAIKKAIAENKTLIKGFEMCVNAAEEGSKAITDIVARRGRASYLGQRSKGHPDVGAVSTCIMLESALEVLNRLQGDRKQSRCARA